MAETGKKATAPRKPRSTATAKKAEAAKPVAAKPAAKKKAAPKTKITPVRTMHAATHEEIARLAHRFWLERGGQHGFDADDWFRAEQMLLGKAS
jgi:hypothetical protein